MTLRRFYARKGGGTNPTNGETSVLLQLNDGVRLPIVQVSDGWYEVELPNGVRGWMNKFAFGAF